MKLQALTALPEDLRPVAAAVGAAAGLSDDSPDWNKLVTLFLFQMLPEVMKLFKKKPVTVAAVTAPPDKATQKKLAKVGAALKKAEEVAFRAYVAAASARLDLDS